MPQVVEVEGVGEVEFPDEFSQDQIREALNSQFKPSAEAAPTAPAEGALPETTFTGALARSFAKGILPAFAARYGAKIGIPLGITTGPGAIATGFAGALGAAAGTAAAQEAAIRAMIPQAEAYERADIEQHPWATRLGGFLSGAPAFKVQPLRGVTALPAFLRGTATKAERLAAQSLGATAGLGAAAGGVGPLLEGRAPTFEDIATGAAMGVTYGEPRGLPFRGRLAAIARAKASGQLPAATAEAERGVQDAIKERVVEEGRVTEYPGVSPEREAAEAGGGYRPEPSPEVKPTEVPQEGQARLLLEENRPAIKLMPDEQGLVEPAIEAERKPDGTWETHDEIIQRYKLKTSDIDRRIFVDKQGNEKSREQTAKELETVGVAPKVEGEAHSTDVNKLVAELEKRVVKVEKGKPLPAEAAQQLEPEGARLLEEALPDVEFAVEIDPTGEAIPAAHRAAMDVRNITSDISAELGRAPSETELTTTRNLRARELGYQDAAEYDMYARGDVPFAASRHAPRRFMYADLASKTIKIMPEQFKAWLREDVPPDRRAAAVRARMNEEVLHLKTPPDLVAPYWDSLSRFEKYAEERIYLGRGYRARVRAGEITPEELGFEAIRRRMQRIARMTTSEAAETAGVERWKVQSLQVLNDIVRSMREATSPSAREQWALIQKLSENLSAASAAVGMQPAGVRRVTEERPAPGMVRLYSGTPGEGITSQWFTEKPERAASFGEFVRTIDVPQEVAAKARQAIRTDYVLPDEWAKQAKFVEEPVEAPVFEVGATRRLEDRYPKMIAGDYLVTVERTEADGTKRLYVASYNPEKVYNIPEINLHAPQIGKPTSVGWSHGILQNNERIIEDGGQSGAAAQEALAPTPAGTRRGQREMAFYMPPVARGQAVERGGFALPTPREISLAADEHWADTTQPPSLDRFKGELESRYGSMKKEAVYYAWQDAMYKKLMSAKGSEIEALVDKLNLRREVAKALKPGEAEPILPRGSIPDQIEIPPVQRELGEIERFFKKRQWKTAAAFRQRFGPKLRARYAAIGEISNKLSEQAGPPPERPIDRSTIGPEDVRQTLVVTREGRAFTDPETGRQTIEGAEYDTLPGWRTLSADERANPQRVAQLATEGARVQGQKFTVSNNVMVMRDKVSLKIIMVSAFADTRGGPKVTNPEAPNQTARFIDEKLLSRYEPMIVAHLRKPVEKLHQVFNTQAEFDAYWGDIAVEGTPGLATSYLTGPQAGTARGVAGLPTGAIIRAGKLPTPFRTAPPPLAPSPMISGARELALPRFARTAVPAGAVPEALGPRPAPERMLTPPPPEPQVERLPMQRPLPYETLPRPTVPRPVTEYGKPAPRQPGTEYRAGLAPEVSRRAPAGVRRNVADEFSAVQSDVGKMVKGWPVGDQIARGMDSASNRANNIANQQENRVRFASALRPPTLGERVAGRWQQGNPQVLSAANVLVEAKAVRPNGTIDPAARAQIGVFKQLVRQGMQGAEHMEQSASWHERRIGRAWVRNQRNLMAELDYAEQHWNDPELQETARRMSQAFREEIDFERSKGFDITQKPGYDPHRYDAALWNGESFLFQLTSYQKKILGRRFRESQLFPSYYHASAKGPYLAVTRDGATLVGHRIRQGQNMILQDAWKEGLRDVKLPDGRPLAIDPVSGAHRKWLSPKADYAVVPGANHLAIQEDFVPLVRQLTDPSHVELFAPTRALLHLSQQLKHSILVGDFFHLGRMIYYGMALMGSKAGYKSGWTVLDIAERDIPEALAKGIVNQKNVDWANAQVPFGRGQITRRQLAEKFYSQMGANMGRVQDALYKDLVTALSPTAGLARRAAVRVLDPSVGRYNRFLFDRLTRGMMAEANVREFERQMRANPNLSPHKLMADIARDVNNFFGNIGRQGWFKSKTWQDTMRIMWLAPQWVEGLIKKEAIGVGRLSGLTSLTGMRQGPTRLGATGRAIGRGMMFMLGLTQAINLITRGKPTWMNEEKEHKFDAYIPSVGGEGEGFWLSPLAIYNEVSHDIYRLILSKPTVADALAQIAGNKEQPVTRALMVALTGQSPLGQKITTTGGRIAEVGKALAPVPISFGRIGQKVLHAAAPGVVPPPPMGATQWQAAATLGIKIEPAETQVQQTSKMAREFMEKEGLTKETGWQQVQTDEPGYSKMRSAIRNKDWAGAKRNLDALRKTRTDREIMRAMHAWSRRGWTGSQRTERLFLDSLTDAEMEVYHRALEDKLDLYNQWVDWMWQQD